MWPREKATGERGRVAGAVQEWKCGSWEGDRKVGRRGDGSVGGGRDGEEESRHVWIV